MKKVSIMLILCSALAFGEVSGNNLPVVREIPLRAAVWNTADKLHDVTPVILGGKRACVYTGSVQTATDEYGNCSDVNLYHLLKVVRTGNTLSCFYDRLLDGNYYLSFHKQKECYDVLASYNGYKFFMGIYFDDIDTPDMYFVNSDTKARMGEHVFEGNLKDFGRVQKQILYRKRQRGAQEDHSVKLW